MSFFMIPDWGIRQFWTAYLMTSTTTPTQPPLSLWGYLDFLVYDADKGRRLRDCGRTEVKRRFMGGIYSFDGC